MSRRHSRQPWRDRLPGRAPETTFRWRGREVSRLENLADAVFGFSVTLLVVALEVPRDVAGLRRTAEGFPAFIACFAVLMFFWNAHYRFFRRYGLEDPTTRALNYVILLLVIFAIYPLKFLFAVWFDAMFGFGPPQPAIRSLDELRFVFRLYGVGLALTWGCFALMYRHAYSLRGRLQLTPPEIEHTRASIAGFIGCISVCVLSVALTFTPLNPSLPGLIYFLIGPAMGGIGWYYGRRIERAAVAPPAPFSGPR